MRRIHHVTLLALLSCAATAQAQSSLPAHGNIAPAPQPTPPQSTRPETPATPSTHAPRQLTLAEAVRQALHIDPLVNESHITVDRDRLAVLRAQLDRVSVTVDGQLQELWDRVSVPGPAQFNCNIPGYGTLTTTKSVCLSYPSATVGSQLTGQFLGQSSLTARANVPLFAGFRIDATVKKAKLNEQAALVNVKQQRKDLAISVARAYWGVRRLDTMAEVQAQALDRMIEAERIATARVRAGLAAPIDKNRATQRKLTQMSTLEDLKGQSRAQLAQLAVTLDLPTELELVDNPPLPEEVPASPTELVRDAWRRRPEVQNAKLQTAIQHQQVRIARSDFFPQLSLFGLYQFGNNVLNVSSGVKNSNDQANPFSNLGGEFTAGAQVTMNFFNMFTTFTNTADAHYLEKIDEQETRRFERQVDGDVRQAHANLLRLYARRAPLQTARDVARDNLTIQEARYKNGDALMTDYLDAQIDLTTAELNLADVNAQLQLQWLELDASLGYIVGADNG